MSIYLNKDSKVIVQGITGGVGTKHTALMLKAGTQVVGDARALPGEDADANGFLTEHGLRDRMLRALQGGQLQVIDRTGSSPVTRSTLPTDMPGVAAPIPPR